MVNNKIKERLRILMWIEEETNTEVVVEAVAKFTARSLQVADPGVNVWQCPWQ